MKINHLFFFTFFRCILQHGFIYLFNALFVHQFECFFIEGLNDFENFFVKFCVKKNRETHQMHLVVCHAHFGADKVSYENDLLFIQS